VVCTTLNSVLKYTNEAYTKNFIIYLSCFKFQLKAIYRVKELSFHKIFFEKTTRK